MKIIYLNCWMGGIKDKLYDFLLRESSNTDIFGLLEVTENMSKDFVNLFPNHQKFYVKNGTKSGQEILVKDDLKVDQYEEIEIRKQEVGDTGCLQKIALNINSKNLLIGSLQGKAQPGTKFDTDIRIKQSEIILKSFSPDTSSIIGGDFNLMPETKSINMLEEAGYINLIKDYKISSTRNDIAWKNFKNQKDFVKQFFADYCFVKGDIKIKSFEVPNIEISDHNPLILEFEV